MKKRNMRKKNKNENQENEIKHKREMSAVFFQQLFILLFHIIFQGNFTSQ